MNEKYDIKAVIGLGNPGPKYYFTRHSIGFQVVDYFARLHNAEWSSKEIMEVAEIPLESGKVFLIKPQTFMNSSGKVIPWLLKKGVKAENIVVVHDELEHPFGKVTMRLGGSAKGHNGLKSIISVCGVDFYRIRCGISRPERREDVPNYVLKRFSESEDDIQQEIEKASDFIEKMISSKE